MVEKKKPFDMKKNKLQFMLSNLYKKISNKEKGGRKDRVIKIVLFVLLGLFVIFFIAASGLFIYHASDAPPLDPDKLQTVETSYVYDFNGEEITALHEEQNRIAVSLEEIPEHVRQAFIAIEDERFYRHFGFDLWGSIRAAYANFRAGMIVQGASTISQQLAQNAYLTTETSYRRKIQEIWLSIKLERILAKEEILELYLNRIYFGNGAYGVEAAAQTYFNKSVGELTVAEAAMLAGAVRSPNFYNPINSESEAEGRMNIVLANMLRLGFINDEEHARALNQRLVYSQAPSPEYPYPHYVDYVVHHELIRILSAMPTIGSRAEAYRAIYTGGLRIYTALDPTLQLHVEEVLSREELYPQTILINMPRAKEAVAALPRDRDLTRSQLQELIDEEDGVPQPQAAIVVADPTTGEIKALGGGREYRKKIDEVLRFATLRQPGSAIKPIITYGPSFEEGVLAGAGSTLDDAPYINPQGNWFPENFDYNFRGMITAREALVYSYNIPAVRAFEKLGPRIGAEYAQNLGISTLHPSEIDNLSLTLGGFTYGVSAIDMAQAYGVFANNGIRVDLHAVEKIVDRHGEVIYENRVNPRQILSPQAAFLVNDILQDFVTQYLGRALQIDRPVAAKTGTTDDWKDVYLVAYTPNLVASFWMGYDEPKMGSIQQGWRYSTVFLREVFLEAFKTLEKVEFERPDGVVRLAVCSRSGLLPTSSCHGSGAVISDYFIVAHAPSETCHMHTGFSYNRPPYIITDERWSEKGGPGRGPEDVVGMRLGSTAAAISELSGITTQDITLFKAYVSSDGITLQWQYSGPPVAGFELRRTIQGGGESATIQIEPDSRQHSDIGIQQNSVYNYTLQAKLADGQLSDPATIVVNTAMASSPAPGIGGMPFGFWRETDTSPVAVPDLINTFQAFAELRISMAGLKVGAIGFRYDNTIRNGYVISMFPEPGTIVSRGSQVNLVVSQGPPPLDQ